MNFFKEKKEKTHVGTINKMLSSLMRYRGSECWKCPYSNDCVVMIWMKRGILNNYKERQTKDQSTRV